MCVGCSTHACRHAWPAYRAHAQVTCGAYALSPECWSLSSRHQHAMLTSGMRFKYQGARMGHLRLEQCTACQKPTQRCCCCCRTKGQPPAHVGERVYAQNSHCNAALHVQAGVAVDSLRAYSNRAAVQQHVQPHDNSALLDAAADAVHNRLGPVHTQPTTPTTAVPAWLAHCWQVIGSVIHKNMQLAIHSHATHNLNCC